MLSLISNLSCKYRRAFFLLRGKRAICYTEHCFGSLLSSLSCNTNHDLNFQIQQNEESAQPPHLSHRNIGKNDTTAPHLPYRVLQLAKDLWNCETAFTAVTTCPEMSSSAESWDNPLSAHHCFFRWCLCVSNLWQPQAKANGVCHKHSPLPPVENMA